MAYDSAKTREKLLDAASAEFTEHGLSGARVDRIAVAAGVNKQAIYAYFGSKEALFDAVLDLSLAHLTATVPITSYDLPGYAVALFDYLCTHPEYERLAMWKRLERADATPEEVEHYRRKLAQIDPAADHAPIDTLLLILGMAHAWANSAPALRALDGDAVNISDQQARYRAALKKAAKAAVEALR
jgi:AcrR family transcriptional regulator